MVFGSGGNLLAMAILDECPSLTIKLDKQYLLSPRTWTNSSPPESPSKEMPDYLSSEDEVKRS
jgi:hypothetical protein